MKKFVFLFSVVGIFAVAGASYAAEFVGQGAGKQVLVQASETHKNLYTAGSNVNIGGSTTGDLTVAGGNVLLNGPVLGGLFAAGGTIYDNASVSGTARIAGGNVNINNAVGGDLLVAGANVSLSQAAAIGGDLLVAGANVNMNAPIAGNAKIVGKMVYINSKINGSVNVTATQELTFGPQAEIVGAVNFRGTKQAFVDPSAKVGAINFTKIEARNGAHQLRALATAGFFIQLLALLVVGSLFIYFRRPFIVATTQYIRTSPWRALGWGLVGLIVIPIVILLLFATVIGYYAAFLLMFSYIILLMLAAIVGALFLGDFALRLTNKHSASFPNWQIVFVGVILWEVLKLIPVLGWIALGILCLMGLGSLLVLVKQSFKISE